MRLNSLIRYVFKNVYIKVILVLLVIIIYLEVYLYQINTLKWPRLICDNEKLCTKIVLVADPQLIGKHNEILHILTPFSIWDSDRYLSKTYKQVFEFVSPDVVIFLGDLFDEGSMSTNLEFKSYVRRLFSIFLGGTYSSVRHIWVPGDNDIGGEGYDLVTSEKIQRFHRAFMQDDVINIKNISFYKINVLINTIPKISDNNQFHNLNEIKIGLSHMPLLRRPSDFFNKVLTKLQPQVLFTAHEHKSTIIKSDTKLENRQIIKVTPDNNEHILDLGISDLYEIVVPTCSYRMGTSNIGFGYALIENNKLHYTVLWSPSRFPQLFFYLILLITFVLTLCCKLHCKLFS